MRHSILHNYFVFPLSDLDVSIVMADRGLDPYKLRVFIKSNQWLWPFVREANIYFVDQIPTIRMQMNPVEQWRDKMTFGLRESPSSLPAQKLTFLVRQLIAGHKVIWETPDLVQKKWQFYFSLLGEKQTCSPQMLYAEILMLINEISALELSPFVDLYLRALETEETGLFFKANKDPFTYALIFNECSFWTPPPIETPLLLELIRCQIQWEICGFISQQGRPFSDIEVQSFKRNLLATRHFGFQDLELLWRWAANELKINDDLTTINRADAHVPEMYCNVPIHWPAGHQRPQSHSQ